MKVAVSSIGTTPEDRLDPRFGRCANFVIVDTDHMTWESIRNDAVSLGGGAGIQAAQTVASRGVSAVITGNVGPNAVRTLAAAGVDVYTRGEGTVAEAVKAFKEGKLSVTTAATVPDRYGTGAGAPPPAGGGAGFAPGPGRGRGGRCRVPGFGRGLGRGLGRRGGLGRGGGFARAMGRRYGL